MKINGLLAIGFVLSLFAAQAEAQSQSVISGGTIRFTGMIVEGPCDISYSSQAATMDCMRNGKNLQQTRRFTNGDGARVLPANLGTTEMRWLDDQRRLGIMTIQYR